ncbi:hypothetical protein BaRGS_00018156 [Batillaria attramentaria]|uniref:Uncharacterized protein n=1 Tax=Batillaria attramentaria TaxID=370345 RepID=A0ABD0KTJ8_9CAEN
MLSPVSSGPIASPMANLLKPVQLPEQPPHTSSERLRPCGRIYNPEHTKDSQLTSLQLTDSSPNLVATKHRPARWPLRVRTSPHNRTPGAPSSISAACGLCP